MVGMTAKTPALLDISRLVSRIGTGPLTGIDRVEAAWLAHVAERDHLLLCRVPGGQALLPPQAGPAVLRWIAGDMTGLPARPGLRDRLAGRKDIQARAQTALRAMAIRVAGRSGRGIAADTLRRLGPGVAYLNFGHANLDPALLANLSRLNRVVMIHDTIPLDHPEFTRAGQSEKFRTRFMTALSLADRIVAISAATAAHIDLWRRRLAITRNPPVTIAHIGTTLAAPDDKAIPADLDLSRPFFVTLGTIEPRKNHALLLDAWAILGRDVAPRDVPRLLIVGRRGWENRALFDRLDRLPPDSPVIECAGLSDGAVAALLTRSHGLLMPSRAEGFGLPLTEAAGRGAPVISAPLEAAREILGEHAFYLSPDDPEAWAKAVAQLSSQPPKHMKKLAIPDWGRHFKEIELAITTPQARVE